MNRQRATLVGIEIRNGGLSASQRAAFTYIADPVIQAVGYYDRVNGEFNPNRQAFAFGASDYVAIQGTGLSPLTEIRINGKLATELRVESPTLISFRLPENTLGELNLSVSNIKHHNQSGVDLALNTDLELQLAARNT